jgi:hypothetical protein
MQFYLNGYEPGDPDTFPAALDSEKRLKGLPDAVDVLIVGSGPAGMVLAAQLSTFPGSARALSSAAAARSKWVRRMAWPAVRSKCSRPSV